MYDWTADYDPSDALADAYEWDRDVWELAQDEEV
jgi:hypothetical protein